VDCPNREDELGCPKCPKGQFLCLSTNKTCILDQYVCDSHPDCKDESDEEDCDHSEVVLLMPTITLIQPIVLHLIYYRKSLFQGIWLNWLSEESNIINWLLLTRQVLQEFLFSKSNTLKVLYSVNLMNNN